MHKDFPRTTKFAQTLGFVAGVFLFFTGLTIGGMESRERQDIFSQDVERFLKLLDSRIPEVRVEGVQGLSHLKHWPAEERLLRLLGDETPIVRREVVLALSRLGTARSVPHFIRMLDDPWWELRQNAWLALQLITAQNFQADSKLWSKWWKNGTPADKEQALLALLTRKTALPNSHPPRRNVLRALRHLATSTVEETLLAYLETKHDPWLRADERAFIAETLDRIGTSRSISILAGERSPEAAWALGRIAGGEAEQALLRFPKTLSVWINLDRLHSTNCGPLIPDLVSDFGLATDRFQPDDLHMEMPQPIQRVAASLINRSGQAQILIEAIVRELELTMNPPVAHTSAGKVPPEWKPMLEKMRAELKPGFVRGDGHTTSPPLTALYHVAEDPALASRLIPLLRHPAFVPRVYVGMLLGKLRAAEAVPHFVQIIQEPYGFSDSTALASGKHFDQSQTVRWRGFLCMALGRLGTDESREALERFASDANAFRDIRYGAVVGLGFMESPKSLPVLNRVAQNDIIWTVRDAARQTAATIQLLNQERTQ